MDEFRAGKLSLEVMTAFTLGADHAAQLAVWRQIKDQPYIQPYTVRRLLTQGAVPLDSRPGRTNQIHPTGSGGGGAKGRGRGAGGPAVIWRLDGWPRSR